VRATKINAGLAESNGRLLLGRWRDSLHVTCGLTACTPGSAPGPTLGNEYGKTLPFFFLIWFGNGVSDLSFFQYFHAVGCEMRQKRRPSYSKHVPLIWKGSFLEQVEKENQGKTG